MSSTTISIQRDGFASKVIRMPRFGFAARCEAVAMPRRESPGYSGYALGVGFAPRLIGPKAAPRAQPKLKKQPSTAGHSHRLTAGGKAEARHANDF